MTGVELVLAIGAVSAALVAIITLAGNLFRAARRFFAMVETLETRTKTLENNGGNSLRDKVDQIGRAQAETAETLADVVSRLDVIDRRQRRRFR